MGRPERRSKGDDAIYFEHDGPCTDTTRHRRCPEGWCGEITTGLSPEGRRLRPRFSGPSKAAGQDAPKELGQDIDAGITSPAKLHRPPVLRGLAGRPGCPSGSADGQELVEQWR